MLCILPYLIYGARDESIHAHWRSFKDGSCVEVEAVDRARTHAAGVTAHESVRHKHGAGWTALSHMATLNGRTGLGLGNSPPLAVNSESRRPLVLLASAFANPFEVLQRIQNLSTRLSLAHSRLVMPLGSPVPRAWAQRDPSYRAGGR